jgi:hypothetical protein
MKSCRWWSWPWLLVSAAMSHMTLSLFQIHSTKHCKLRSWEIFLLVNLFIWAWRVCCAEFWLAHGVNWTPPRKGVANPISDWLMHLVVVGDTVTLNELEAWPYSDTMWGSQLLRGLSLEAICESGWDVQAMSFVMYFFSVASKTVLSFSFLFSISLANVMPDIRNLSV